jgi:drug/metabolite transporter (DMT)-like permease
VAIAAGFAVVLLSALVFALAVALAEAVLPKSWLMALTPMTNFFGVVLMLFVWPMSVVWVYKVMRWRDETWDGAACWACGYNLTGNTSGICSECGIQLYAHSGSRRIDVN